MNNDEEDIFSIENILNENTDDCTNNNSDDTSDNMSDSSDNMSVNENNDLINNNLIDAQKYIIEIYLDQTNENPEGEIVRWFAYFIPEYKIEIAVKSYNSTTSRFNSESIKINKTSEPKNTYLMSLSGAKCEAQLENVKVNKKWVDDCVILYEKTQYVKTLQYQLYLRAPIAKTRDTTIEEIFAEGMRGFESHNFKMGRKKFLECLKILNGDTFDEHYYLACYNIACCYSRERKTQKSLSWLHKAISSGYTNWEHTITDRDMEIMVNEPYFVELIKKMILANPKRSLTHSGIPEELNSVDIFLKKHNLEHLEAKPKINTFLKK